MPNPNPCKSAATLKLRCTTDPDGYKIEPFYRTAGTNFVTGHGSFCTRQGRRFRGIEFEADERRLTGVCYSGRQAELLFDNHGSDLFIGGQALQNFADAILKQGRHPLMSRCLKQFRRACTALYEVLDRF